MKKYYDFSGDQSGGGSLPKVETQFATSMEADLEAGTWTFLMDKPLKFWKVFPGRFAIVDIQEYGELAALKEENERLRDELKGLAKTTGMVVTVQGKTLVEGVDFTCIGGTIVLAKHVFT